MNKKNELLAINALRKEEGLPPIEPGTVTCLRCDTDFESWDKRNNRICDACKKDDDYADMASYMIAVDSIDDMFRPETMTDELQSILSYSATRVIYPVEMLDTTLMDREDL